jgi:ketol-acid reductoisomerase
MLKSIRSILTVAAVSVALSGIAANAVADDTQWQKDHPRREQVNNRLKNQNQRIHNEVKSGQISKARAAKLHHEDHALRTEERTMASTDHSHLTKTDQRALNQQENQVSKQIGR